VAALEVLVGTQPVRTMIRDAKDHQVNNVIQTGRKEGMQLLDQHLKELISTGIVDASEAARYSEDPQAILAYGRSAATARGASPAGGGARGVPGGAGA
jgi:Tfp pilus assembly pilus retraction ATPase PilT